MNKELENKFRAYEQQIMQLQEQLHAVEQAILDMGKVSSGIKDLKGKKGEEIFAPIGRGIFVKAELLDEELLVDVGEKNLVSKSIEETVSLVSGQQEKLEDIRKQFENELNAINQELTKEFMEYQKKHSESCSCEESCSENCSEESCNC